jgi:hypothetical protein
MSKKTNETTQEGEPQEEHQVLKPPPISRSISNKERGEKTFFIKQTKHFIYVKKKYIANS